jgi:hypothetical protein
LNLALYVNPWSASGGPARRVRNRASTCASGVNTCNGVNFPGSPAAKVIINGSFNADAAGASNDNVANLTFAAFASLTIASGYTVNGIDSLTISGVTRNAARLNRPAGVLTLSWEYGQYRQR